MKVSFGIVLCMATSAQAFFGGGNKRAAAPAVSKAVTDEAVAIYQNKFQKKDKKTTRPFFSSWGMPKRDVDGTELTIGKGGSSAGKGIFDIDESVQRASFNEIARLYGESEALEMTKIMPTVLAFDSSNFADSLAAFSETFGEEDAKAMVMRNPGLLAINPLNAANADGQTMQFSYIVSATRPFGNILLPGILGLLCIPAIEGATGIPIRSTFFATLFGSSSGQVLNTLQDVGSIAL
uniref:Uncharacterized protein n=1 Tax=Ditylum brightwellii TaxID=49249 RepID=A0A6U3ZTQ5_9STRA|mmetsp:Transcript_448/g.545  ORF Transcript_448/g.545 Transcript_448/m.545 type:complete len:237 (-) Transcript_448:87-797(-)